MNQLFLILKKYSPVVFFTLVVNFSFAQTDTEFPKGFILYAKVHNGMITDFTSRPDLYAGGLQLAPQYAIVPHLLRGGIIAGGFFANKRIQGEFGPSLSLKLKTLRANLQGAPVGSVGNINLLVDHIWGTGGQRLFGGGIIVDVGNLINLGITAHRDYGLNNWWFQSEIGIRISKKHKIPRI